MNYDLKVKGKFDAAHSLENYDGECARLHGHTWHVTACFTISPKVFPKNGILVDFKKLKFILNETLKRYDHRLLNSVLDDNPTAENLVTDIYSRIIGILITSNINVKLSWVEVWETENAGVRVYG